jgi:phthalate 4,5-dioxygenase
MLTQEENEFVCRVGRGTPMGNFIRQYWIPAMLSSELPGPDCAPVRVLLLGEQLVAFRDTQGQIGLLQNNCPHRGASLFYGRNEEGGLRCIYHGWKYDVHGQCVEQLNEPDDSKFMDRIKARAYPCVERNGAVWTYMGSQNPPPPLPEIEANMIAGSRTLAIEHDHNWLQVLEGTIDTSHASILHGGSHRWQDEPEGSFAYYLLRKRALKFETLDTPIGVCAGAHCEATPDQDYWRVANFMLPFYGMSPVGGVLGGAPSDATATVPMDDEHTMYIKFIAGPVSEEHRQRQAERGRGPEAGYNLLPNSTDWYGRFRGAANASNDFNLDRELQRRNQGGNGYSGIPIVRNQDRAITSSMGPIYDRAEEHLGSTDAQIVRTRLRLLREARAFAETGTAPPGVEQPELYHVRSGEMLLEKGIDWIEATRELRKAFVEHPDLDWTKAQARQRADTGAPSSAEAVAGARD